MATKRHEDEGQNPVSMVFAGDSERHHFQNFVFFDKMYCSTSFLQFRGQKLEQVFFDIVLSPNILICLVVQLGIGQAIDPCLHTTTYEAFAPSPQLVNLRNVPHVDKAKKRSTSVTFRMWPKPRKEAPA